MPRAPLDMPACPPPALSRRSVLLGAAGLAALGATSAGCGSPPPPETDALEQQLQLARRDSEMAGAAAEVASPFYAPVLTVVATQRAEHATAIADELARATGAPLATTHIATPTSTPQAPRPTLEQVRAAVRESAESAADAAARESGYRAGLMGSIAASCAASVAVPLAMKEQRR